MNICGIDVSTKAVDLVLIHIDDHQPPVWHRYELAGQDAWERTRSIPHAMPTRHDSMWDDVAAIGVENPAGTHGAHAIQRAVGAVLACLPPLTLVQPWRPSEWRKAVGLPGNATKDAVRSHALARASDMETKERIDGWCSNRAKWSQDACDAFCIAIATRAAIEQEKAA